MSYDSETNKEYLRNRYAQQRQGFIKYLGGLCALCGATENLEIDHIDWRLKSFPVSGLWPVKKLPLVYRELDKCQLLCRTHHIEKSRNDLSEIRAENGSFTHGTMYGWMKVKCKCGICEIAHKEYNSLRREKRRLG